MGVPTTKNENRVMSLVETEKSVGHRKPSLFRFGTSTAFLYGALFLNIILWAAPIIFVGTGDEIVILRYNAYFGINLTGSSWQVLLIPFMASVFFVPHVFLASIFVRNKVFFPALLLMVSSFLVQGAALIAVAALIMVN